MKTFIKWLSVILLAAISCCAVLVDAFGDSVIIAAAVLFLLINFFPSGKPYGANIRLKLCQNGADTLYVFLFSSILCVIYHITAAFFLIPGKWQLWLISALLGIIVEGAVFIKGIIIVYCASVQLGIRTRVIGVLCGLVPVANIFVLVRIIEIVSDEVLFETKKAELNKQRKGLQICKTKYPVLLVHGVFFRDFKHLNYWGRVPKELQQNGATIFYGNHQSAASVADCGQELFLRIKSIIEETGCEKVNIIAHSKGGLDCRYAISLCGAAPLVASLTTINTPHRGCEFADYLLNKISPKIQNHVANRYNSASKKLGDQSPDFMSAVRDLSASRCAELNKKLPDNENVFYQCVGSALKHAYGGKFPLNFSYNLVNRFDGENDGLVSATSFLWGSQYAFLRPSGSRGISHGDMIDLNRENIKGFDVREFYVGLLSSLREKGF